MGGRVLIKAKTQNNSNLTSQASQERVEMRKFLGQPSFPHRKILLRPIPGGRIFSLNTYSYSPMPISIHSFHKHLLYYDLGIQWCKSENFCPHEVYSLVAADYGGREQGC